MHLWGPEESISSPCFSVFRQALVTSVDVAWCLSPCVSFLSECSATSCQNVCAGSKSLAQQSSKCFGAQCLRMEPPRRMEAHGRMATKCQKKKKNLNRGGGRLNDATVATTSLRSSKGKGKDMRP